MPTFADLIIAASSLPQGATLAQHLHHLNQGGYSPVPSEGVVGNIQSGEFSNTFDDGEVTDILGCE